MIYTENCFMSGLKFNLGKRCYVRHRTLIYRVINIPLVLLKLKERLHVCLSSPHFKLLFIWVQCTFDSIFT